jgi:hypothetical protein
MLATVEQDWKLVESLPPGLEPKELSVSSIDAALEVLHTQHEADLEAGDDKAAARTAFWLASLQFDHAGHPKISPGLAEDYFDDGMLYLDRIREVKGVSLRTRNRADLLGVGAEMQQLFVLGEEPTVATKAQYGKRLARIAYSALQDASRTRVERTDELIDATIPLLLSSKGVLPRIANARERCHIPTPHPELSSQRHQHFVMEGGRKIAVRTVFQGRNGRAHGIPGQLSHICLQSLARHHMKKQNPAAFHELDQKQVTGNISYYVLSWAVRNTLGKPVKPEELLTVDALTEDILDRIKEVAEAKPSEAESNPNR